KAAGLGTLTLRGSFDSEIELYSTPQSGVWRIADSFGPNAKIRLRNGGLTGQIAIGADGLGVDATGLWTDRWVNGAEIHVARTSDFNGHQHLITGPMYTRHPDDLGGGAAGLQPYLRHNSACMPKADTSILIGKIDRNSFEVDPPCINDFPEIRVALYGQVDPVGSLSLSDAIKLHHRPNTSVGWGDPVSANVNSTDGRVFKITRPMGGSWEPGQYRVTIVEDSLQVRANNVVDIGNDDGVQLPIPGDIYVFWL